MMEIKITMKSGHCYNSVIVNEDMSFREFANKALGGDTVIFDDFAVQSSEIERIDLIKGGK